ncbi:MAG: hypothetical protein IJ660_05610 [Alphaproteobacteria bacterium]|nr:hypothetical protein [Alphaproteobacteria bacterium]
MTDIWNKEIVLTDEDKQRLGITDEQIAAMEAKKQQNSFTDYVNTGEQLATSALNGVSQGYYDEYEGGASALGYGLANLGMRAGQALGFNIQAPQEDVWSAMKRGYINGRDYRRRVLEGARREMPWLSTGMEAAGAVVSPANKVLGPISTGILSGYGNVNTNDPDEIFGNMVVGAVGNQIGEKVGSIIPNRAWAPIARAGLRESVSIGAQNIYDKK